MEYATTDDSLSSPTQNNFQIFDYEHVCEIVHYSREREANICIVEDGLKHEPQARALIIRGNANSFQYKNVMNQTPTEMSNAPHSFIKWNDNISEHNLTEWNLEWLKQAAWEQRLVRPRGLAWAILLQALPSPQADIVTSLKSHRNFYNELRLKLSMDPRAVVGDDPLSQSDESVWKQHFCDNELKAVIMQDVVRTFPDELYFRDKDVQDTLVRVLFFWARSHSHVGYRQGMHEIVAPILFELFQDRRFAPKELNKSLKCILDDDYLEHDSYMLFNAVMRGLERFYTTGEVVPSPGGRLPTSKMVHNPNEVVRYLDQVREEFLVPLDHEVAAHLASCNITMELFGIRWLRLLFGREFTRGEIPHLWGFIFADGPSLPHIHFIIVAMLMSLRNILLDAEPGAVLSALMRPLPLSAAYVCALGRHLRAPLQHPRPPPPRPHPRPAPASPSETTSSWSLEQEGVNTEADPDSGSEGVPEGGDVARELAALALLRARLPPAAARLAAALPRPPPKAAQPLHQILQLAALLQCRNHALIDVETALEAAEGGNSDKVGRRQLVPVTLVPKPSPNKTPHKPISRIKEVPLKLFHQVECHTASDLPFLDPLRLRTE